MSPRVWLIFAGVSFASAAALHLVPETRTERLTAQPMVQEVGISPDDPVAAFVVRLRNDASVSIQLIRAIPDCSCTRAKFESLALGSGESTQLSGSITLEPSDSTRRQTVTIHYQREDEDRILKLELTVLAKRRTKERT